MVKWSKKESPKPIPDKELDRINGMLEIIKRTEVLAANAANRSANHWYYIAREKLESQPKGSTTLTNVDQELLVGLIFAQTQVTQNLSAMWQFTQAQLRQRLFDLGLISEKVPLIEASCMVDKDGKLVVGGSGTGC